jgi:phage/conjugal plasmid C-4 type zinc finger TraR family protein
MHASNREVENAERAIERDRDLAVDRIRRDLELQGETDCRDCGDPIDTARLMALPSARRCFDCQEAHERAKRTR